MPPKKKKPPVNVVVGTVSTRSTRRQSIVNIEIPKSKRSPTKKPTAKDEKDSLTITPVITPNNQTQSNVGKNVPKKIQHSRTSAAESKVTRRSSTQAPRRGRSLGSLPDSNKELLRILDDWTDEEAQDRTDTSSVDYTESECGSSIGHENINSGTERLKATFENQFQDSSQGSVVELTTEEDIVEGTEEFVEADQIEEPLEESRDSANTDGEVSEHISPCVENEDDVVIIENTNSSSGMCVPEVVEQCIVEDNVIIEDSQEARDDVLVECVTDDVVSTGELMTDETSAEISQAMTDGAPQSDEDVQIDTSETACELTLEDEEQMQQETGEVHEISSKECFDQIGEAPPQEEYVTDPQSDYSVDPPQSDYEEIGEIPPEDHETIREMPPRDFESMSEVPQEDYEAIAEIHGKYTEAFQNDATDTPGEETEAVDETYLQGDDDVYTGQMDESSQEQTGQNDENYLQGDEEVDTKQIDESSQEQPGPVDEASQEYDEGIIQEFEELPNETSQEVFEAADQDSQEAFEVIQADTEIRSENDQEYQIESTVSNAVEESIAVVNEENSQFLPNIDSNYAAERDDETNVTGEEVPLEGGIEVMQYDNISQEQFVQDEEYKSGSAFSTAELERTLSEGITQDTTEGIEKEGEAKRGATLNEDVFQSTAEDSVLYSKMAFLDLQSTNNEAKDIEQEMAEMNLDTKEEMPDKSLTDSKKKDEKAKPRSRHSKSADPKTNLLKLQKPKEKVSKPKAIKEKGIKEKTVKPKLFKDKEPKGEKKSNTKKSTKENGGRKEASEKLSAKTEEERKSEEDQEVRRSSRIKSISVQKKRTTGHGLVKYKSETSLMDVDLFDANSSNADSDKGTPSASPKVKERKSRWSKSLETVQQPQQLGSTENMVSNDSKMVLDEKPQIPSGDDPVVQARLRSFVHLKENMYKTDRLTCKEAKKMICDCFLTEEEITANEYGCGEDCLNRLLLIECGNLCQVGDRCTNKRFQKSHFAPVEVFNTDKKGLGLRAAANIPFGEFILEYVGEVLNTDEFDKRAEVYSQDKNIHYYFMALRADAVIDATMKGNISRFINHSCDPNAETQKWTVNGELRIGFFSTRTILAGEEITFDYRFQRYGKEAQKCYCGAAICRGWLGEQPDSDEEEEEEVVEEEMVAVAEAEPHKEAIFLSTDVTKEAIADVKAELPMEDAAVPKIVIEGAVKEEVAKETIPGAVLAVDAAPVVIRKKVVKKKPRIEMFEEIDQLNEEIDMLVTTGLKNQAHTLKLSRLMVRAKEPQQRAKLLRVLRKGELPCRRLFLDYHGLKLMHGYMIDAQHLVMADKKFESQRLEMLQTLAVLPIPNKTMLQDSKVLPTVELWATTKELTSPLDSDSNSPKSEQFDRGTTVSKKEDTDKMKIDPVSGRSIEDQEEEIRFLASKLLEEWRNLKEVFKIPKKERIEQMKEHEREANKKFMQSSYSQEPEKDRKSERYRNIAKIKERDLGVPTKRPQKGEKLSAEFIRLTKVERRKLFALQHELKEEERRLKQRELWRQHEMNCMMMGTDPRFTAPFDPSRPYQCIWNPQIGQWQNYPLPPGTILPPAPTASLPNLPQHNMNMPHANLNINMQHNMNMPLPPPHQIPKSMANYPYGSTISTNIGGVMGAPSRQSMPPLPPTSMAQMTPIQGMPQVPSSNVQMLQYQEQKLKEEDPSQVKFMGPIPPPVKLPPKWKSAKDKYGRPYYYHIKIRKSQWEPPPLPPPPPPVDDAEESSETESSSDTSSLSSSSDSDDSEDAMDDTKLLQHVRRQMDKAAKAVSKTVDNVRVESMVLASTPSPTMSDQPSEDKLEVEMRDSPLAGTSLGDCDESLERPSIDIRLKEQFSFMRDDNPSSSKKRRVGLCEEIIISPRSEEDKKHLKEDLKRYKANKEKLRRQKELLLRQSRLKEKERLRKEKTRLSLKEKIKEMPDFNSEIAKKIKETFRANMASTVVTSLNAYRKLDCREGRITNTEDFKHLARKLTHFVMLKEMKHISRIDDLTCTDNVKMKAREYIRKYMSKFGEMYVKRNDSPDFKD